MIGEAIDPLVEQRRIRLEPVVEERRAEPVHGRTAHTEVGVAPLAEIARVALPLVGDPDATREPDLLVDDDDLAMRPVVRVTEPEPTERPEPADLDTALLHAMDEIL